ncbi:MAG: alpha/beta hydrolase fold domain-containing protein [Pyrinomonadaceae bacterium]
MIRTVFGSILVVISVVLFSSSAFSQSFHDDFNGLPLDASWITFKAPETSRFSLSQIPGKLRLKGSTVTLDDGEVGPVMLARSVKQAEFEATAELEFSPVKAGETAGMDLRVNDRRHYEFGIRSNGKSREIYLRFAIGSVKTIAAVESIGNGAVKLRMRSYPRYVRFSYSVGGNDFTEIGGVEALQSPEVFVGIFASGNGRESMANADFDWFDLNLTPKDRYADLVINDPNLPKGYTIFSVGAAEKGIIEKYPFITRPSSAVPASVEFQKGLVYAKYIDREMHIDLFKPKGTGKYPAVIIVHGGAWITGHYTMENPLAIALANREYVAVTVEHRLSNEKKYPAQIHDLKSAVRWLRANAAKFNIDPNRIGAVGGSSGGHLVALLGSTNGIPSFEGDGENAKFSSRVQSVVDIDGTATFIDPGNVAKEIKGPYDTNTRLTGYTYAENPAIWKEASPITHVNKMSASTLFLNSSSFRPFQQREEMSAKLKALGIESEIVVVPDTPHPFWLFRPWFDVTVENIDSFFRKTMNRH